jgi:DNA-binding response OmpR family regulator
MAAPVSVVKGGRILVVDDEPMVRDTLCQVLTDEGYVVDVAGDGSDALAHVHATRPDAILLDLMMPGMNGRQFLQALRDDPTYSTVPVLIMTAVHGLEVNLAAIGASAVVEKPINVDDLLNKLALAIYRSRDAEVHASYAQPSEPEPVPADRGVVLVIEHDRARLQHLDMLLSQRGYTVVTMTRARVQATRLARALRPHAILLEAAAEGIAEVVRALRDLSEPIPLLVFARDAATGFPDALAHATDPDLINFVETIGR